MRFSESTAQINYRVDEWRVETSKLIVRAMNSFGDEVFAGTSGGLVIYSPTGTKTITVLDGLSSLDISSMAVDETGIVILGMNSPTGNIDFYSSTDGSIYSIDENLTKITSIAVVGDSIYAGFIALDQIGVLLVTFDGISGRYQFRDSFLNFPEGISFSEVGAISVIQDSIYLGTDGGLLSASILGDNLKDPANWVHLKLNTGEKEFVNAIGLTEGKLIVALKRGVFRRDEASWIQDGIYSPLSLVVSAFYNTSDATFMATNVGIYKRNVGGGWSLFTSRRTNTADLTENSAGILWAGFSINGPAEYDEASSRFVSRALNSPFNNVLAAMSNVIDSTMWIGSDKGFSKLSPDGWKSYLHSTNGETRLNDSEIELDRYIADTLTIPRSGIHVSLAASNGLVYFGYGGRGMLEFDPESPADFTLYDASNGFLSGSEGHGGASHFVVIRDITEDNSGNIWIANAFAQDNRHLAVIDTFNQWHYFQKSATGLINGVLGAITHDSRGNVWLGMQADSEVLLPEGGLQVLNYSGTLSDKSDDIWVRLTKVDGLESNHVKDIAVDGDDVLWIAVVGGVHRLVIPQELTRESLRANLSGIIPIVSDHDVRKLEVDSRNNKWFATETGGVKVLLNDNTWLNGNEGFTVDNSPLLSNAIESIAFNPKNGDAFIATLKGISILRTEYSEPLFTLEKVKTYPSPFIIPANSDLVIDGLADNAGVKILDINGDLIRNLTSGSREIRGSQGFWDGRDDDGRIVPSGIYIAFIYTSLELKATAKIAVIRR